MLKRFSPLCNLEDIILHRPLSSFQLNLDIVHRLLLFSTGAGTGRGGIS
jgi:hypothetical protein